jgi:serpin B
MHGLARWMGLAVVVVATSSPARAKEPQVPVDPSLAGRSSTAFAFDLHHALGATKGNLFFSPYSVFVALAMTQEGAAGETAAEMGRVLHVPAGGLASGVRALTDALVAPQVEERTPQGDSRQVAAYEIAVANRLWGQKGYAFERPFLEALEGSFGAGLETIDFGQSEAAREAINTWVERATRDKIEDIVPPGLPTTDTRLVLANAIYLKAPWLEPFPERGTREEPFTTGDGREVHPSTMHRTDRLRTGEADAVRFLELPYRGNALSMVIVLPKAKDGLPAVERDLSAERFAAWLEGMRSARVALALPKFRFTTGADLSAALAGMGMRQAFDAQRADFSRMTKEDPLFIGAVLHKAFVAVDESGTEAAAATVVMMRAGSAAPPAEPIPFVVDHPFLFAIVHRATGAVLFLGRVDDPTAS